MDVSILPLQKIFALDVQFRVPLYQRRPVLVVSAR